MNWKIEFSKKASKRVKKLPKRELSLLDALVSDLLNRGPVLPDWKNYLKLGNCEYHCHLSYKWVACWRVEKEEICLIEIYYIGSREDAPYG